MLVIVTKPFILFKNFPLIISPQSTADPPQNAADFKYCPPGFCYLCEHNGLLKVDGGPLKFSSNICTQMMGSSVDHRFSSFFYLAILNIERTQPPSASITAPRRYQQLCAGKLKIYPGSEFEGNYLNRIKLPYKSTSLITNCISIAPSPHQANTSPPPLQKTITFVQEL